MRFPTWALPVVLRFLSLAGLTSAGGDDQAKALVFGFALSPTVPAASPAESLSQPRLDSFSLDLDFFVQAANYELKVPIMPLHLLGKKSWNVYNQDNIEKVKRDEAVAKAKEEAEEQRMQEIDAERRMQILRGETPTPLAIEDKPDDDTRESRSYGSGRERKRRKRAGENDTEFEMRIAHEQTLASNADKQIVLRKSVDAPLVDHSGHIDLFPQERPKLAEKNSEAEQEAAKKKKEYEDQYTMRFSTAAGFKQGLENPWYSKPNASKEKAEEEVPGTDVWGNEDPRRKEREVARLVSNDPLAAMRQGAAQVRQVDRERRRWREDKEREMRELEAEERRNKRKRRYEEDDDDDLEDFSLDQTKRDSSRRRDDNHDKHRRRRHKEVRRSSHRDDDRRHKHRHRHHHRS